MLMKVAMSTSASTKVALERILWAAGVSKLSELLEHMYRFGPVDPTSITVPMLCLAGEGESNHQRAQLEHVYEHLPNPKKAKRIFTVKEGGDANCQKNNFPLLQETAFGWLEDIWR
jgi:hypothetical protein